MGKRMMSLVLAGVLVLGGAGFAAAASKLFVYTSMKESLIGDLKTAFVKKHPDIKLDYQSAGAGKLMAKIAAERESGKILADVLWTSRGARLLPAARRRACCSPTSPPKSKALFNPLPDYDGSFTAVRLGTLGIAYNTRFIKEAPKTWAGPAEARLQGRLRHRQPGAVRHRLHERGGARARPSAGSTSRGCAPTAPRWARAPGRWSTTPPRATSSRASRSTTSRSTRSTRARPWRWSIRRRCW